MDFPGTFNRAGSGSAASPRRPLLFAHQTPQRPTWAAVFCFSEKLIGRRYQLQDIQRMDAASLHGQFSFKRRTGAACSASGNAHRPWYFSSMASRKNATARRRQTNAVTMVACCGKMSWLLFAQPQRGIAQLASG
jgi:hypothetical protein